LHFQNAVLLPFSGKASLIKAPSLRSGQDITELFVMLAAAAGRQFAVPLAIEGFSTMNNFFIVISLTEKLLLDRAAAN
jgi:hypothetical protein